MYLTTKDWAWHSHRVLISTPVVPPKSNHCAKSHQHAFFRDCNVILGLYPSVDSDIDTTTPASNRFGVDFTTEQCWREVREPLYALHCNSGLDTHGECSAEIRARGMRLGRPAALLT